jgi:hypothetical protein
METSGEEIASANWIKEKINDKLQLDKVKAGKTIS